MIFQEITSMNVEKIIDFSYPMKKVSEEDFHRSVCDCETEGEF